MLQQQWQVIVLQLSIQLPIDDRMQILVVPFLSGFAAVNQYFFIDVSSSFVWIKESQFNNFVLSQTFDEEENISSSKHLKLFFFAGS